jgi:hypothetical protein
MMESSFLVSSSVAVRGQERPPREEGEGSAPFRKRKRNEAAGAGRPTIPILENEATQRVPRT